ncbi:hypothetical protein [Duganella violaceipulchra]|uniref:DUF1640 domain-containing protein n=1 Tax=Duganella violaceipulchra TaxID=2849652 RepID=A0AA41H956_9BURK|nr:hypothetical protein [Duganella violaceicalia]MBV6322949.1 hypothetical protein [Duganella violaceicalia]MCP2008030.1 hypothetical protein [Duganella violaceicalia]
MDEQITQLDRRLTSVEKEVAALAADTASIRPHYATKEDFAKLEAKVSIIQSNYATKEDIADLKLYLAKLETRMTLWAIAAFISISGVVVAAIKLWP